MTTEQTANLRLSRRRLGHHAASFTLDTYIGLLNEELPEPTFFDDKSDVLTKDEADDSEPVNLSLAATR